MNIRVYNTLYKAASLDKEARVGRLTMLGRKLGLLKMPKGGLGFRNLYNSIDLVDAMNLDNLRRSDLAKRRVLRSLAQDAKLYDKNVPVDGMDMHKIVGHMPNQIDARLLMTPKNMAAWDSKISEHLADQLGVARKGVGTQLKQLILSGEEVRDKLLRLGNLKSAEIQKLHNIMAERLQQVTSNSINKFSPSSVFNVDGARNRLISSFIKAGLGEGHNYGLPWHLDRFLQAASGAANVRKSLRDFLNKLK